MHHFIYATKDAWISSGSNVATTGISQKDQNYGKDPILELKKFYYNDSFDHETRILISFAGDAFNEMSNSLGSPADGNVSSSIPHASTGLTKYYLRLYEADGTQELSSDYEIQAFPVSQSWEEGTGKFGDNPKVTNGVSWENRSYNPGASAVTWSHYSGGTAATATLTFVTGDRPEVGDTLTLISTDSTPVTYTWVTAANESAADAKVHASNTTTTQVDSLNNAIVHSNNHGGKISVSQDGTGLIMTLTQAVVGTSGNTTITKTGAIDGQLDITQWAGGADDSRHGGNFMTGSLLERSQSFSNQSPDIEMDITDIVDSWLVGSASNNGLLLRFSGSLAHTNGIILNDTAGITGSFAQLKFFSADTHTIYPPKLEVRWDDHFACSGSNTGNMLPITSSGQADNYLYMIDFKERYKENEKVKFRVGARKRYIQKSFSTSLHTVSSSYFGEGSGSYSILDVATGETMVPFSAYTSMSCDSKSNYFIQWLDGFAPDRVYKILYKLKYDDGQEQIYDNDFEFIVTR